MKNIYEEARQRLKKTGTNEKSADVKQTPDFVKQRNKLRAITEEEVEQKENIDPEFARVQLHEVGSTPQQTPVKQKASNAVVTRKGTPFPGNLVVEGKAIPRTPLLPILEAAMETKTPLKFDPKGSGGGYPKATPKKHNIIPTVLFTTPAREAISDDNSSISTLTEERIVHDLLSQAEIHVPQNIVTSPQIDSVTVASKAVNFDQIQKDINERQPQAPSLQDFSKIITGFVKSYRAVGGRTGAFDMKISKKEGRHEIWTESFGKTEIDALNALKDSVGKEILQFKKNKDGLVVGAGITIDADMTDRDLVDHARKAVESYKENRAAKKSSFAQTARFMAPTAGKQR